MDDLGVLFVPTNHLQWQFGVWKEGGNSALRAHTSLRLLRQKAWRYGSREGRELLAVQPHYCFSGDSKLSYLMSLPLSLLIVK